MDKGLATPPTAAMPAPAGEMAAEPAKKNQDSHVEKTKPKAVAGGSRTSTKGMTALTTKRRWCRRQKTWAPSVSSPRRPYAGDYSGPRTDFRDDRPQQPVVHTGKDSRGTVTFYLSDAVTSFPWVSEGVGGGVAGRDETVKIEPAV